MSAPETVTMTIEVPIADADGKPIREGSVLQSLDDNERGVVTKILRKGDRGPIFGAIGDLVICSSLQRCAQRITNRYSRWRHVQEDELTTLEKFASWQARPYDHFLESISPDEGLAVDGILALLPPGAVDWDYDPVDRLEDALAALAKYIDQLREVQARR